MVAFTSQISGKGEGFYISFSLPFSVSPQNILAGVKKFKDKEK